MEVSKAERIKIPFHIHPYEFEKGLHAVEKADSEGGKKRRYLKGFSSGMKVDGHGERMTKECIKNMQEQAKSGNILLYAGQHGVDHTDDVGKLVDSEISPTGDWITTYRLYDEDDGFAPDSKTLEKADKLWKQVNGLPPYDKPMQKGFSVEGYIPDDGILVMDDTGARTINKVDLDGVLVTPRPSYKTSVISAIYKALDELEPEKKLSITETIRGQFMQSLEEEKKRESYYTKRYKLEDLLNDSIDLIMSKGLQVKERLNLLFDEYKQAMIQLLIDHEIVFSTGEKPDIPSNDGAVEVAKNMQLHRILKDVEGSLLAYVNIKKDLLVQKAKQKKN